MVPAGSADAVNRLCSEFPYLFKAAPSGAAAHSSTVPSRQRGVRPGRPIPARGGVEAQLPRTPGGAR